MRNPSDSYQPITWTGNSATVTVDDNSPDMPVQTQDGRRYLIASIVDESGNNVSTVPAEYFPLDGANLQISLVADGGTVTITTVEKEAKKFTFIGNPEQVKISMNYAEQTPVDGGWVIVPDNYASIEIAARSGYLLNGVTDSKGNSLSVYNGKVSIYESSYSSSETFTISSVDEAEVRTASFTVVVDGDYGQVQISRKSDNNTWTLTSDETVIHFDPATETGYSFSNATWGKSFYSVMLNELPVQAEGSNWNVTVSDGDIVSIATNFPDVDVPVHFTFTNEGTEAAISGVYVNGNNVNDWLSPDFTVKMGSMLSVSTNTSDYEISSATLNGSPISVYSYQTTVATPDELNFVYTATKFQPYTVTVETDCPEGIRLYNDYNPTPSSLIQCEFDADGIGVFEIPRSKPYLCIAAADNYMVTAIESGSDTYNANSSIYISGNMEFFVSAEPLSRENILTLFVAPGIWYYRNFTTAYGNTALSRQFADSELPLGYSEFNFGSMDFPFYFSGYPECYVYHNGESVPNNYGIYIHSAASGDVVKMFPSEPSTYTVTYDIDERVNVEVCHDRTMPVENPSVHSVIGTTEIVITPAATSRETTSPIVVTVNNEPVNLIDGKYTATIESDSYISVAPGSTSGVESVVDESAGKGDATVYNLQGIVVGSASAFDALPAGIYIVNGEKVRR